MRNVARGFGAGAGAALGVLAVLAPILGWLSTRNARHLARVLGTARQREAGR